MHYLSPHSTFLQNGINPAQGVFIEAFITAVLVMAVLMLAAEKVMHMGLFHSADFTQLLRLPAWCNAHRSCESVAARLCS